MHNVYMTEDSELNVAEARRELFIPGALFELSDNLLAVLTRGY